MFKIQGKGSNFLLSFDKRTGHSFSRKVALSNSSEVAFKPGISAEIISREKQLMILNRLQRCVGVSRISQYD